MRIDAQRLGQVAHALTVRTQSSDPFLDAILDAPPKPWFRLAVDPNAMAVACTLYAGQAAKSLGRRRLARDLFISILDTDLDPEYAYYIQQSGRELVQMEHDVSVVRGTGNPSLSVAAK